MAQSLNYYELEVFRVHGSLFKEMEWVNYVEHTGY
jgi:hypothetical protein